MRLHDITEADNVANKAIQMIKENDNNLYSYLNTMSLYELLILLDEFHNNFSNCFHLEHKNVLKNIFITIINKLNKHTLNISDKYLDNRNKYYDIAFFIDRIYRYGWIYFLNDELKEIFNMIKRLPYDSLGKIKKDRYSYGILDYDYPKFIREVRKSKGLSIGKEAFKETTSLTNETHKEILDYLWLKKTRITYDEHYQRLLGIKDKEVLNRKYPKLEKTLK